MSKNVRTAIAFVLLGGVVLLALVGRYMTSGEKPLLVREQKAILSIMSTRGKIVLAVPADRPELTRTAYQSAVKAARRVETLMSAHMEGTDIHALNEASANHLVPVMPGTVRVLEAAQTLHQQTAGAFDVTVGPVIELWKEAASEDRLPTSSELAEARAASSWEQLDISPNGVTKSSDSVRVDLGGIAKGYAIDQAVEALRARDVPGGLVEIGGDLRCFGRHYDGRPWTVAVQNPFDPNGKQALCYLALDGEDAAAVCTSGNYRRSITIAEQQFSHIIDPRTAMPVDHAPSVTVVAPTAMRADAWATALSVLGPDGLEMLPPEGKIEAMIVTGTADAMKTFRTPGFEKLILQNQPAALPLGFVGR
ncbi:MAG: FAD:protein FMN transferase [Phycisphaerae bacterium]